MTAKPLLDREPVRVQAMLDKETVRCLDRLVEEVCDLNSRSAAIRYAARIAVQCLDIETLRGKQSHVERES